MSCTGDLKLMNNECEPACLPGYYANIFNVCVLCPGHINGCVGCDALKCFKCDTSVTSSIKTLNFWKILIALDKWRLKENYDP